MAINMWAGIAALVLAIAVPFANRGVSTKVKLEEVSVGDGKDGGTIGIVTLVLIGLLAALAIAVWPLFTIRATMSGPPLVVGAVPRTARVTRVVLSREGEDTFYTSVYWKQAATDPERRTNLRLADSSKHGLGLREFEAMAPVGSLPASQVGPVAVEVRKLGRDSFWLARASDDAKVAKYISGDTVRWSVPNLEQGIAFTYLTPGMHYFAPVLGPFVGVRSLVEGIVIAVMLLLVGFASMIATAAKSLSAVIWGWLKSFMPHASGGDTPSTAPAESPPVES
jgi:hypothetical protein